MAMDAPDPETRLVPVMETTEFALVALARAALDEAGIDCMVEDHALSSQIMGQRSSMTVGETVVPVRILVRPEDEAAARDLLRDLANDPIGVPAQAASRPAAAGVSATPADPALATIELVDEQSGIAIGRITPDQLDSLQTYLEEESEDDRDYYIDRPTLQVLADAGVDQAVLAILERALGTREGVDVLWREVE